MSSYFGLIPQSFLSYSLANPYLASIEAKPSMISCLYWENNKMYRMKEANPTPIAAIVNVSRVVAVKDAANTAINTVFNNLKFKLILSEH